MASNDITMPASELSKHITANVRLTGVRTFQARVWVAIQLIKLAALVAGFGIHVDVTTGGEEQ